MEQQQKKMLTQSSFRSWRDEKPVFNSFCWVKLIYGKKVRLAKYLPYSEGDDVYPGWYFFDNAGSPRGRNGDLWCYAIPPDLAENNITQS